MYVQHDINHHNNAYTPQKQETRGATARYAEALGPVLDPHLLREVLALLRAYPELVEARVLGTGPKAGVVVGGKAPGGAGKKKVTAAEVKVRAYGYISMGM